MEFRVFGGVEALRDGELIDIGHSRQRSVLAILLVEADRLVTVDELIERVWADEAPQRARGALHTYLSGLRQALAPDVRLERQSGGYRLAVDPLTVDAHRFRHLVVRARAGEADADLFDEALALWRGRPFGPLDTPWINEVRESLERERHMAELDRNDQALAQGRHVELIEGLTAAAVTHPFDERLTGQLMLALYRSGRQADALRYYETTRRQLATELGVDPSPALQAVHRQLLTDGARAACAQVGTPTAALDNPAVPAPPTFRKPDWSTPAPPSVPPIGPRVAAGICVALLMITSAALAYALSNHTPAASNAPGSRPGTPTSVSTPSGTRATFMANTCDLPTEAHPGSYWEPPSYGNCQDCEQKAKAENGRHTRFFYCTYNPHNGKTDLHYDPR